MKSAARLIISEEFLKGTTPKTKTQNPLHCWKASRGWTTPGKGKLWFLRSCLNLPGEGPLHWSCAAPDTRTVFTEQNGFCICQSGRETSPSCPVLERTLLSLFLSPQWSVTHTMTLMNEKHCQDSWSGHDFNELDTAQPSAVTVRILFICFMISIEWTARKITNGWIENICFQSMPSLKWMFIGCNE